MSDIQPKLRFDANRPEDCIEVWIHAPGMPNEPHPEILVDLLSALEGKGDISPLLKKFPGEEAVLKELQKVLGQGKIDKEETFGFRYWHIYGWSIKTVIVTQTGEKAQIQETTQINEKS